MTFCYWGGNCGAKSFVRSLLQYNSKNYARIFPYIVEYIHPTCHWIGEKVNEHSIYDYTKKVSRIHRHIDKPEELLSVSHTVRKVDYISGLIRMQKGRLKVSLDKNHQLQYSGVHYPISAIIPDELDACVSLRGYGRSENIEYSEEFSSLKYKDTLMYYETIGNCRKSNNFGKLMSVSIDDVPDCHMIMPFANLANSSFEKAIIPDTFNRFTNILPIKTDIIESAINQLDNWNDYYNESPCNEVFNWYHFDRKRLWRYLDFRVFEANYKIERKLRSYGIKYEYFDMDKGDWAKTFQLERNLPRLLTHHVYVQVRNAKDKKSARKNYHRLRDIAKEWYAERGRERKDNSLLTSL